MLVLPSAPLSNCCHSSSAVILATAPVLAARLCFKHDEGDPWESPRVAAAVMTAPLWTSDGTRLSDGDCVGGLGSADTGHGSTVALLVGVKDGRLPAGASPDERDAAMASHADESLAWLASLPPTLDGYRPAPPQPCTASTDAPAEESAAASPRPQALFRLSARNAADFTEAVAQASSGGPAWGLRRLWVQGMGAADEGCAEAWAAVGELVRSSTCLTGLSLDVYTQPATAVAGTLSSLGSPSLKRLEIQADCCCICPAALGEVLDRLPALEELTLTGIFAARGASEEPLADALRRHPSLLALEVDRCLLRTTAAWTAVGSAIAGAGRLRELELTNSGSECSEQKFARFGGLLSHLGRCTSLTSLTLDNEYREYDDEMCDDPGTDSDGSCAGDGLSGQAALFDAVASGTVPLVKVHLTGVPRLSGAAALGRALASSTRLRWLTLAQLPRELTGARLLAAGLASGSVERLALSVSLHAAGGGAGVVDTLSAAVAASTSVRRLMLSHCFTCKSISPFGACMDRFLSGIAGPCALARRLNSITVSGPLSESGFASMAAIVGQSRSLQHLRLETWCDPGLAAHHPALEELRDAVRSSRSLEVITLADSSSSDTLAETHVAMLEASKDAALRLLLWRRRARLLRWRQAANAIEV